MLEDIKIAPSSAGPVPELHLEPIGKRVRALIGDVAVADSTRVMMMYEPSRLGVYHFPVEDVRIDLLVPGDRVETSPQKGDATYYSITVDGRTVENAAWRYQAPPAEHAEIAGYIAFHWRLMDAWFEEDEEVFVHAKDPHHRIDILRSSRRVQVVIGGETVADTTSARFLFETGLPVRYYIPAGDVRTDLLRTSDTVTACAYKGTTTAYWQADTGDGNIRDVAWSYATPADETAKIAGMIAFFNERVDAILVDGVAQPRPQTHWA